jgi:hypothetical protein
MLTQLILKDIPYKHATYSFGWGKYDTFKVIVLKENGYINASKLCLNAGKEYYRWNETNKAKESIKYYNSLTGTGVTISVLDVSNKLRGTYVHPKLLPEIMKWISRKPSKQTEAGVRDLIAKQLNGRIEVTTPVGRIDVLTDTLLIEVKNACHWKSALGQVIAYGMYYPDHKKVIWLFGYNTKNIIMESALENMGIYLRWVGMDNEFLLDKEILSDKDTKILELEEMVMSVLKDKNIEILELENVILLKDIKILKLKNIIKNL